MIYHFTGINTQQPIFVDTVGYDWIQGVIDRPNGYPYYHWIFSNSGSGHFNINGEEFDLTEGMGLIIEKDIPHCYYPTSSQWLVSFFTFDGFILEEYFSKIFLHKYGILKKNNVFDFAEITKNVAINIQSEGFFSQTDASAGVYKFLLEFSKFFKNDYFNEYGIAVKKTLDYFNKTYSAPYDIEKLTHYVGYSQNYLNKIFKTLTGETLYSYLQALKIRKAKNLLLSNHELSISQISDSLGYNAVSQFITKFKTSEGITPLQFRKNNLPLSLNE